MQPDGTLHKDTAHRTAVHKCTVYRTGGDELALLCVKRVGTPLEAFHVVLEQLAEHLAAIDETVDGLNANAEQRSVPTFLRIGAASSACAARLHLPCR